MVADYLIPCMTRGHFKNTYKFLNLRALKNFNVAWKVHPYTEIFAGENLRALRFKICLNAPRPPATIALNILDKWALVVHKKEFKIPLSSQSWEMMENPNIFSVAEINSAQQALSVLPLYHKIAVMSSPLSHPHQQYACIVAFEYLILPIYANLSHHITMPPPPKGSSKNVWANNYSQY